MDVIISDFLKRWAELKPNFAVPNEHRDAVLLDLQRRIRGLSWNKTSGKLHTIVAALTYPFYFHDYNRDGNNVDDDDITLSYAWVPVNPDWVRGQPTALLFMDRVFYFAVPVWCSPGDAFLVVGDFYWWVRRTPPGRRIWHMNTPEPLSTPPMPASAGTENEPGEVFGATVAAATATAPASGPAAAAAAELTTAAPTAAQLYAAAVRVGVQTELVVPSNLAADANATIGSKSGKKTETTKNKKKRKKKKKTKKQPAKVEVLFRGRILQFATADHGCPLVFETVRALSLIHI